MPLYPPIVHTLIQQEETTRIFLVDDQPMTGHVLRRLLADEVGFELHCCVDPEQAITEAERIQPAVILLDWVMPTISGMELLLQLRTMAAFRYTPIIMLSAQDEASHKAEAFGNGANDYLIKLPDKVEMVARLRYHANVFITLMRNLMAEEELRASEEEFRTIIQSVKDGIVSVDRFGYITLWNDGAQTIFGYREEEVIGQPMCLLVPEHLRNAHDSGMQLAVANGRLNMPSHAVELMGLHQLGHEFPVELSLTTWTRAGDRYFSAVIRDITKRKEAEKIIRHQAHYDVLTDLPNRLFFQELLERYLKLTLRQKNTLALLFIDLDRFKWVNDTLGHAAGDDLLREVALRLKICVRQSDVVARLGGDEFTAILLNIGHADNARRVAVKILESLQQPFLLEGQEVTISGSIGITLYPQEAEDLEGLVRNADNAMYVAKNSGRNAAWFFNPTLNQAATGLT